MRKFLSFCIAAAFLLVPFPSQSSQASPDIFVSVSDRFIEVAAGTDSQTGGTIRLAATLYQPRLLPSAPAVIYIHGWGGRRLTGSDNLAYYIAAAGYTVLSYTARGFGDGESGGHVTLAGPDEMNDLKSVIDWIVDDPTNAIGPRVTKIGVIGGSYGGGHSFQISSDPRVSAVIPLIGWTDLEQSLFPNGVFNYAQGLGQFYGGLDTHVGSAPFYNYDRLQFEMFDAAAEGHAPAQSVKQALRARSIAEHDGSGRVTLMQSKQPRVPTFIIHSWDDYLFPATQVLDVYSQITAPKQIYLGRNGHPPGGHSYDGEEAYIGVQVLRWFDHYLRGIGGKDSKTVTSAPAPFGGQLFASTRFPSADARSETLYLKAGGGLSKKKKKKTLEETTGVIFRRQRIRSSLAGASLPTRSDMLSGTVEPSGLLPRQLVYTHGPFTTDTELMGAGEYNLYVSSATSTIVDVIVRAYDVAPDGKETEVTVGVMRVSNLTPGQVKLVTFRDFGDHWVFREGHRLKLKVTNVDFPSFRPPGVNDDTPSEITIHYGRSFPSRVQLPLRAL